MPVECFCSIKRKLLRFVLLDFLTKNNVLESRSQFLVTLTMLILKLLQLFILYIYLNIAETFEVSSINKSNEKLSTSLLNILCSTDSNTIRLLVVDGIFDETDEFIARLNNECPFKTVQLSTINAITTKSVHRHSEVIVFMLDSNDSIHDFEQAVTKFQDSDNHKRFVVLSRFQYDLRMLANVFRTLARQTVFNIVVVMHADDLEEIVLQYNPFDGTTHIVGSALKLERRELFVRNQSDLYGRKVVISMHEQFDRAISNKNGTTGYTGVDGLVADLLEERYVMYRKHFFNKMLEVEERRTASTYTEQIE